MKNEMGNIQVAKDVFAAIASIAISSIDGVVSTSSSLIEGIRDAMKKVSTKGVRVEAGEQQVALDISIKVQYGCNIMEVAEKVQYAIVKDIRDMTGYEVTEVNVQVESVLIPEENTAVTKRVT